ncbi:MAG: RQC domain-containing protein, partial [Gammaproteobacteria bacterium]
EQFKRIERARLDAMLGLCEITSCRRQSLLHYFGEDSPERCGNCDTCLQPVPTWDGTEAARKALSCVYRTGQRFGVAYLIDVLLGAESDKIFQNDHHHVSTYGIGKELTANAWRSVFRQLVARGYLGVDHASYGGLFLNEKSRALLKGEEAIALRVDTQEPSEKAVKKARSKHSIADADRTLWEALRECRKQLAIENDVAPYVIFHDASLMDMLHYRPLTEAQFLSISGVGQSKLEKYGAAFLEVIRAHED